MEQRATIIGLGVKNLEVSTKFYQKQFGWKLMASSNESISYFQLNGILLSLYPLEKLAEDAHVSSEGSGFKGFTLAYNTRSKEEVDSLFENLKKRDSTTVLSLFSIKTTYLIPIKTNIYQSYWGFSPIFPFIGLVLPCRATEPIPVKGGALPLPVSV